MLSEFSIRERFLVSCNGIERREITGVCDLTHHDGKIATEQGNVRSVLVSAEMKLYRRGCGRKLGLGYAAIPRLSRYSSGLREPREILIRFSLCHRM